MNADCKEAFIKFDRDLDKLNHKLSDIKTKIKDLEKDHKEHGHGDIVGYNKDYKPSKLPY